MANSDTTSWTLNNKRTVTTIEHFEWDPEKGEWKPTHKSVTTETTPSDPAPYVAPWRDHPPYTPYYPYQSPAFC